MQTVLGLNCPRRLQAAVAMVAGAMLLVELMTTRLFSVLFFYHFSFFAVSLVMSGLALGGLLVSRCNVRDLSLGALTNRLAALALAFSGCVLVALLQTSLAPPTDEQLGLGRVALHALVSLPALVAAGAFLGVAFAHRESWIGSLYAADLTAAGAACVSAIALMRFVQGPAMLLCPALLSAIAAAILRPSSRTRRAAAVVLVLACGAGIAASLATRGRFLALPLESPPLFERWNEHSRIVAYPVGPAGKESDRMLLIDRSAVAFMPRVPASRLRGRFEIEPDWGNSSRYIAYRLGRRVDSAAIIGVGGGEDLGPPLAHGVARIDGYEINGILVDLLRRRWSDFNALASRPEIHLIHNEARVGIARSAVRYDLIQASLIDTWAATANGGFVLSESGLYTVEGWRTLLRALSDHGLLTMTRWYLPEAPAEMQRLASLAVAALSDAGIGDPAAHLILVGDSVSARLPFPVRGAARRTTRRMDGAAHVGSEWRRLYRRVHPCRGSRLCLRQPREPARRAAVLRRHVACRSGCAEAAVRKAGRGRGRGSRPHDVSGSQGSRAVANACVVGPCTCEVKGPLLNMGVGGELLDREGARTLRVQAESSFGRPSGSYWYFVTR